jgi:hypothetical protein
VFEINALEVIVAIELAIDSAPPDGDVFNENVQDRIDIVDESMPIAPPITPPSAFELLVNVQEATDAVDTESMYIAPPLTAMLDVNVQEAIVVVDAEIDSAPP